MNDPLAGIGTNVSASAPATATPASSDPLANVGKPVTTSTTPPAGDDGTDVSGVLPFNLEVGEGALKSAASGVGGLLSMFGKYGLLPLSAGEKNPGGPETEIKPLMDAGNYLQNHFQQHGVAQHIGGAAELIGELLSPLGVGDAPTEGGRGLSFVERMTQQAKVAKFLADHPKIAALTAVGARTTHAALKAATETGAQTFVHSGGDPQQAAEAGAAGGVTAGIATPLAEGVSTFLANRVPAAESIAGVDVPVARSQRAGALQPKAIPARELQSTVQAQQQAAPRVFTNIAQRATRDALDEANQGRVIPNQVTDTARLLAPPTEDGVTPISVQSGELQVGRPYPFTIRGAAPVESTEGEILQPAAKRQQAAFKPPSFVTSSAEKPTVEGVEGTTGADVATSTPREPQRDVASGQGDIVAAGAETAQMHLSRLNDIVDNPPPNMKPAQLHAIEAARDDLQEQMNLYHRYQRTLPNFAPVDSERAAASVANFGEAADQLQNAAQPIYQKIDEATGGEFNTVNRARRAALKRGDYTAAHGYESRIQQMIADTRAISPDERVQGARLWSKSMVLDGIDSAIDHAANVNERYASEVAGGRVLEGTRLRNGLQQLIDRYGSERIESVVGREGMQNLTRMSDLLQLPKTEQETMRGISLGIFHNLAHGKVLGAAGALIGHHFAGFEGALAGAYGGAQAERMVLRMIATSPRAGELFDYAVRNKVTPKLAAGLISAEILREHQADQEQPQQQEEEGATQ